MRRRVTAADCAKVASAKHLKSLIPTPNPGSYASEDSAIRLARKTEWIDHAYGLRTGLGQRMLATDCGEYAIMDIRAIQFERSPTDEEAHARSDS